MYSSEQRIVTKVFTLREGSWAPNWPQIQQYAFTAELNTNFAIRSKRWSSIETRTANRLLQLLPHDYLETLLPRMEEVKLPVPTTLYRPGVTPKYVHFITSGMVSIVIFMQDGHGVEVGLVGSESLVEGFQVLGNSRVPTTGFLQVDGTALRLPFAEVSREVATNKVLHALVLRSVQAQGLVVQQLAACNRLHEVEERLSRWLLSVSDRLGKTEFAITQEFLAQMIGAQRTTVTLAAGNLQRSGLIEYRRGHMVLLDRERLESAACECYPIIRGLMLNMYENV